MRKSIMIWFWKLKYELRWLANKFNIVSTAIQKSMVIQFPLVEYQIEEKKVYLLWCSSTADAIYRYNSFYWCVC
jgi:hypothetical protein